MTFLISLMTVFGSKSLCLHHWFLHTSIQDYPILPLSGFLLRLLGDEVALRKSIHRCDQQQKSLRAIQDGKFDESERNHCGGNSAFFVAGDGEDIGCLVLLLLIVMVRMIGVCPRIDFGDTL